MQTQARIIARSEAAIAVADTRALVSFVSLILVSLLSLALILEPGAELLRGP